MILARSRSPYPLGASFYRDMKTGKFCLHIAFLLAEGDDAEDAGILFKGKDGALQRVALSPAFSFGRLRSAEFQDVSEERLEYVFYAGKRRFPDPYGKSFPTHNEWGASLAEEELFAEVKRERDFAWDGEERPVIPSGERIVYGLHVRGFTRDKSSKVRHKGTFLGVKEKLPYLKELGVNALLFMPVYTFLERERKALPHTENRAAGDAAEASAGAADTGLAIAKLKRDETGEYVEEKLNYWGYKKSFYYAPNGVYAVRDAEEECRELVRACHAEGVEVFLQFYFPREFPRGEIPRILQYWRIAYHVDGFRLLGEELPFISIAEDPLLSDCVLIGTSFPLGSLHGSKEKLCECPTEFTETMRKFLKGDEATLRRAFELITERPARPCSLRRMADYEGFRLMDLVSYERKHNEANGEENRDGSDYNFSWNCGVEGKTRKTGVLSLRYTLLKNALCLLFLSGGTPYLFMGDERGSTQEGNNNPYCQDNELSWLSWKLNKRNEDLLAFTRRLIALRREQACFRETALPKSASGRSISLPDISCHGEQAFRPEFMSYSRTVGILYNGECFAGREGRSAACFYAAYNMHWTEHRFALPELSGGEEYALCLDTSESVFSPAGSRVVTEEGKRFLIVPPRSICVYKSMLKGRAEAAPDA